MRLKIQVRFKFLFARFAIGALFFIVTLLQLFSFPGQFNYSRQQGDMGLFSQVALTLFFGAWMFAAQWGLVSLWKILTYMEGGKFFTSDCMAWIDRIVAALKYSAFVPVVLIGLIAPQADDPGIMVALLGLLFFTSSLAVLAVLLRDQILSRLVD